MEIMNKIEQMRQLKKKGLSYGSIGELFGISRQRVHQIISGYITSDERKQKRNKEYNKLYKFIFERDSFECQICRERGNLIHHIDRNNYNNSLGNLVCLCNNCHLKLHRPKEMSEMSKEKDRQSNIGKKRSEETKRKMKQALKKRLRNNKGQFIKTLAGHN